MLTPVARNRTLILGLALLGSIAGCDCGADPTVLGDAGPGGADGAGGPGADGGAEGTDGALSGTDGAASGTDGALSGTDGAVAGDGGSPFEEPLSAFCMGMGAPVVVGSANQCAGDLAQNTFRFALCACDTVQVQSTLTLDAFDSRRGPYGASLPGGGVNVLDDGQLGTNAPLSMRGKLEVRGSAYTGRGFSVGAQSAISRDLYTAGTATQSGSSSSIARDAYVRGDLVGRYEIAGDLHTRAGSSIDRATTVGGRTIREDIPLIEPCACGSLLDIGGITRFGRTHNDNAVRRVITATTWSRPGGPTRVELPCGRYYLERIQTTSGLEIVALGRVVLFVDGDMNVEGGLTITATRGAELDLFVAGSLTTRAAARIGSEDAPSSVRTYVGGSGDIVLAASTVFGGFVYAPRARVVFGASASLYGGLFARRAELSGSARIHFDTAVRSAGGSCELPDAGVPGAADGGPLTDGGLAPDAGGPADVGPAPDAAPLSGDGGPPPSRCECGKACGNLACLEGQCVACQSALDCCAPFSCVAGLCTLGF